MVAVYGPPVIVVDSKSRRNPLAGLHELWAFRQVLQELVKRDLRVRYKRSVLGFAWTMLNPLLMMIVTTIIFSSIFRFAVHNYPTYMLAGQVLWGFFASATIAANSSLLASAALSRRVYVPWALFPLATVSSAVVNLLLALAPLFLLALASGVEFTWSLVCLPLSLVLAFLFTFGVALLLASSSVFFHDTIHMYQVVVSAWMYLTPIFYPVDIVPPEWLFIFHLNPMYHLVEIFRIPIYTGGWPDPSHFVASTLYALGAVAGGWWYFERSRDSFVSYL
jgi:ABC-type polysaccharide/polyol phosphate export permease